MTNRIFKSILFTSLAAIMLVAVFIMFTLSSISETDAINKLKIEANSMANLLKQKQNIPEYLKKDYSGNRITFIAKDGTVIYDNTANPLSMENHADRPEVRAALKTGTGESARYSDTLSQKTIYYALKTDDGNILRVSMTQSSVLKLLGGILPVLSIIILGIALLSFLIARYLARNITAPINALNLDTPFENEIYDELSPLLTRIERQNKEIASKMLEITEKQREFTTVVENMREGLILLSNKGNILFINGSAAEIFKTNMDTCLGNHILSINRSLSLQSVFEEAIKGVNTEALLKTNGKHYQLLGNSVVSTEGQPGAVILVLDVTDKQSAERSRREFTANVSHELKTPLTSILGFAEIMKGCLTKPEDMPGFAERIYNEANRLLALIDDILELSQLDEKAKLPDQELVDLYALAEDILSRLKPLTDKLGITLAVQGEHLKVVAYRKILDEMLYNLCDNAIKYNVAGGSVTVRIEEQDNKPVISVKDTGIGIPAEHLPHLFERFYRVDKSRSKDIGGTGLGLSIVKHGALLHDMMIDLESEEKVGTTFTLTFPPA